MLYVRTLTEAEQRELRQGARREVGRVAERMRMVLLSARGYTVPQSAEIFECDEATVRRWIERYEAQGAAGLHDLPRSGRPRCADAAAQERIGGALEAGPGEDAQPGYWSVLVLMLHLGTTGLRISASTLRRLLPRLGYVWRRPRHVLPRDPEAAPKMQDLAGRIFRAPADAVVLCLDECDLHLLPVLRGMWMKRSCQAEGQTPGKNQKRSIFGALEIETGRWLYQISQRKRTVEFITFLEQILESYPAQPLLLVLDNASIHHSRALLVWWSEHPRIELLHLPSYAGHRENPVEKIWWRLKDQVAANRLRGSMEALISAAERFFVELTPEAALRLAA
jgi:transposase